MLHSRPGKISAISDAGDGQHSRIEIRHGKQKRDKGSGELVGYHRHTSTVHVPNADAKHYAIGDRVHGGLEKANDAAVDPEPGEFDDQDDATDAQAIPGKSTPPKGPPAKALAKAGSKFKAAMGRR